MADKKISALTSATTPLAGTEVFPLVQGGNTVKTPVNSVITSGLAASFGAVTATASGVPAITAIRDLDVGVVGDAAQIIALGARNGTTPTAGTDLLGVLEGSGTSGRVAIRTLTSGSMTSKLSVSSAGDITADTGNLVLGTAGKGITTSVTNGDVNLIPNGSGIVASDRGHSFNKIGSRRLAKVVDAASTAVLTVTPVTTNSTHTTIRVDINVAFTASTNLQYHAGYLVLTCNDGTGGGGTAIAEYFDGSVGNFAVATTDFVVTRPSGGQIVITYTNNNGGAAQNSIEFAVTGVFAAATVA
jgi:hypothetical protein